MFGWDNKRVGTVNGTASSPSADNGTIQHLNVHTYGTSSTLPLLSISKKLCWNGLETFHYASSLYSLASSANSTKPQYNSSYPKPIAFITSIFLSEMRSQMRFYHSNSLYNCSYASTFPFTKVYTKQTPFPLLHL